MGFVPRFPPHSSGKALASSSLSLRSLNSLGRKGKPFWSPLQKSREAESSVLLSPWDRIWGWEGSGTRRGRGCACSALGEPCCAPGPLPYVSKSPAAWAHPGGLTGAMTAAAGPQAAGLGLGQAAALQGLRGALL